MTAIEHQNPPGQGTIPPATPAATIPPPQPPAPSGMWAPYEPPVIGEEIKVLKEGGSPFVLVAAELRENVKTSFGPKTAVDLTVQTTTPGSTRLFSGFDAGIVGQVSRIEPGNLPAVCEIIEQETGKGKTAGLQLVRQIPRDLDDLAGIAAALPVAVVALAGEDGIPY